MWLMCSLEEIIGYLLCLHSTRDIGNIVQNRKYVALYDVVLDIWTDIRPKKYLIYGHMYKKMLVLIYKHGTIKRVIVY